MKPVVRRVFHWRGSGPYARRPHQLLKFRQFNRNKPALPSRPNVRVCRTCAILTPVPGESSMSHHRHCHSSLLVRSSQIIRSAFRPVVESLEDRRLMSTTVPAYLVPTAPGVAIKPLLTTGDSVGGYRMAGIPDGLGAYDNGDGTFTVLMNHEIGTKTVAGVTTPLGAVRAHGSAGAFVSKWVFDKAT